MIKLDYSIESPAERVALVNQILLENPHPDEKYLEVLSDYLVLCMEKQEKREKKILTENRMSTINKRETSYEGLVSQLESGEDGIYNLINESKTTIFQPKVTITKKDLEEIPPLKQLREAIHRWEEKMLTSQGRDSFIIKKALIAMRKDQYIIKNAYRKPIIASTSQRPRGYITMEEKNTLSSDLKVIAEGFSLCSSEVCSLLLCNYSRLKQECYDNFEGDLWYLMESFDQVSNKALKDYPIYEEIVTLKIDGMQNISLVYGEKKYLI